MELRSEKSRPSRLCLVIVLCFWTSCVSGLPTTKNMLQVQALLGIKGELKDPDNVLANWDEYFVDPCVWTMVSCSDDGFVVALRIPSQNLSGQLSPSISNLTNLEKVFLQNNSISGPIPAELGRLSKLQQLDLSQNSFTGRIPSELSHLRSLQILRLNNNNLTDPIPPSFADMTQLTFMDLSYNNLSPPLPKLLAKTFKVVGNPLLCATGHEKDCYWTPQMPTTINSSNSQNFESSESRKSHNLGLALVLSLGCICILLLSVSFLLWWRRRLNKQIFFDVNEQHSEELCLGNLRKFHFRELQAATNNFSSKNLIGK
ncbi:hypothetical protein CRG98_017139, partial [Punica granatum]